MQYFCDLMQLLHGMWVYLKPNSLNKNQSEISNICTVSYSWKEQQTQKNYTKNYRYSIKNNLLDLFKY